MLKKFSIAITIGLVLVTGILSAETALRKRILAESPRETVVLTKKNTAVLRGEVTDRSVAVVEETLKNLSRGLQPNEPIYLVMDTPGGVVDAGLDLVDFVNGLPQKVKTISLRSLSMGFYIVQLLDERLAVEHSLLMEHPGGFGVSGPTLNVLSFIKAQNSRTEELDRKVSKRIGISYEKFKELIHDDLWVSGKEAFKLNMVDKIVNVRCDSSLDGVYKYVDFNPETGPTEMTMSNCPLIRAPIR